MGRRGGDDRCGAAEQDRVPAMAAGTADRVDLGISSRRRMVTGPIFWEKIGRGGRN
jgi:hypothetical protein